MAMLRMCTKPTPLGGPYIERGPGEHKREGTDRSAPRASMVVAGSVGVPVMELVSARNGRLAETIEPFAVVDDLELERRMLDARLLELLQHPVERDRMVVEVGDHGVPAHRHHPARHRPDVEVVYVLDAVDPQEAPADV